MIRRNDDRYVFRDNDIVSQVYNCDNTYHFFDNDFGFLLIFDFSFDDLFVVFYISSFTVVDLRLMFSDITLYIGGDVTVVYAGFLDGEDEVLVLNTSSTISSEYMDGDFFIILFLFTIVLRNTCGNSFILRRRMSIYRHLYVHIG